MIMIMTFRIQLQILNATSSLKPLVSVSPAMVYQNLHAIFELDCGVKHLTMKAMSKIAGRGRHKQTSRACGRPVPHVGTKPSGRHS